MKTLFTLFLVLNLLAETLAAVTLISGPLGLQAPEPIEGSRWAMNYGFAVIAIASAIFWLWTKRSSLGAVTPVLGMLMIFHISLAIALSMDSTQFAGFVLHSILAVIAVVLFSQRSRWCTDA